MKSFYRSIMKTDIQLLDEIKKKFDLSSDLEIERRTGIDHGNIAKIRKGERKLSPQHRLMIADALGFAWAREALLFILPEKAKQTIIKADNLRTKRNDEKRSGNKKA